MKTMNRKITSSEKAQMKMESAIWNHGRKKGLLTTIINKIKETGLQEHPDIKKAIGVLETERLKLQKTQLF